MIREINLKTQENYENYLMQIFKHKHSKKDLHI